MVVGDPVSFDLIKYVFSWKRSIEFNGKHLIKSKARGLPVYRLILIFMSRIGTKQQRNECMNNENQND